MREHDRQYKEANRDKIHDQKTRYREVNREKVLEWDRDRYRRIREVNPERFREKHRSQWAKLRAQVFDHYGWICSCLECGSTERLTIDHVNGDGRAHRAELGGRRSSARAVYRWLIREGFPEGFQTLCRPCNASKGNGLVCRLHDASRPIAVRLGDFEMAALDTLIADGVVGSRAEALIWVVRRYAAPPPSAARETEGPMTKTTAKCTPCATERKTREKLGSLLFPAEFRCPHPGSGPVPAFPLRYAGDRHCPECSMLVAVEVTVEGPERIGYRCVQGHMWLAANPVARTAPAGSPPAPTPPR